MSVLNGRGAHSVDGTGITTSPPAERDANGTGAAKTGESMSKHSEDTDRKMKRKEYEKELAEAQTELCLMQEWVKHAACG